MSVSELSTSTQNYLKVIWGLQEWSSEPVTATAVAARAGVRLSTASDAVRKLAEQGLTDHTPYGAVRLTDAGRTHALAMVRRHRLIETFLVEVLGYGWDEVHDEAEHLEHAVSDDLIDRIDDHLGHPERDPHGDPIPRRDGHVVHPDATRLTEATSGTTVLVERISDGDPDLLRFFAEHGLVVGSRVHVQPGAPYSEALSVTVDEGGEPIPLGRAATDSVWVTPTG